MEERRDIYKTSEQVDAIAKKIAGSKKINKFNKKKIAEFTQLCKARGLMPASIRKDLYSLYFIAKHTKKKFPDATKKDIIKLQSLIKSKKWSEETKKNHSIALKKFYKWLYGMEEKGQYPECVAWINTTIRKSRTKLPEDLITEDEIEQMLQVADNKRDKAFTLLLYETGARIGEILNVKVKHIVFQDNIGFVMLNGKTGMRRVTVIASVPILAQFLDIHPFKERPDEYLFMTKFNHMEGKRGYRQLTYAGARKILKTLAEKANIKKRIHPHLFRHSSATRAAKFLTEAQMKEYYGWTMSSDMPSIYVHMSARDTEDAIKRMNGINIEEKQQVKKTIVACRTCKQKNSPGSKFCNYCGSILSLETAVNINTLLQNILAKAPELLKKTDEEILEEHKLRNK